MQTVGQLSQPFKIVSHHRQLAVAVVNRVHGLPEGLRLRQAVCVPAYVLARAAHTGMVAIEAVMVLQMVKQQTLHLGHQGGRQQTAVRQKMLYFILE